MPSPRWAMIDPKAAPLFAALAAAQHAAWRVPEAQRRAVFTDRFRQLVGAVRADLHLNYALAMFDSQCAPPDGWQDPPENVHFDCCARCMELSAKRYSQAPNGRVKLNALRDREWLARQIEHGRTPLQIAQQLGCTDGAVKIWIDRYGLERTRHLLNDDDVAHLHDEGFAPGEISQRLDIRTLDVRRILKRTRGVTLKAGHHYFKKEWWVERIVTKQMTTNECARAAGIYPHACCYWLKRFGLQSITKARSTTTLGKRFRLKYPVLGDPAAVKALWEKHRTWEGISLELTGKRSSAGNVKNWWVHHFGALPTNGRHKKVSPPTAPHLQRGWWEERIAAGRTIPEMTAELGTISLHSATEKLRTFGGDLLGRAYRNATKAERTRRKPAPKPWWAKSDEPAPAEDLAHA